MENTTHVVALLSGGLDSILAVKILEKQGVKVTCLHFVTPFFNKTEMLERWKNYYNLNLRLIDISDDFVDMLIQRPQYGFGKIMNPCVDCKILMMKHAKRIMEEEGACAIVSGEVLGQRPMSQRRETLNLIQKSANVKGYLLRPLCAKNMEPTIAERNGWIDRDKLFSISGRSRKEQLKLAGLFELQEIPSPAGGCRLAEKENARTYWHILKNIQKPKSSDFRLANVGRQFWAEDTNNWLVIGRRHLENDKLMMEASSKDLIIKVKDFAGPIGLARYTGEEWPPEIVAKAVAQVASYSSKAVKHFEETGECVQVRIHKGSLDLPGEEVLIIPKRIHNLWKETDWHESREELRSEARSKFELENAVSP